MKGIGRLNCIGLACCLLLVGSLVLAAGGQGNQGPRFAGQGLDDTMPVTGGGSQSKGIQVYNLNLAGGFPAPPATFGATMSPTTAQMNYQLSNVQCTRHA